MALTAILLVIRVSGAPTGGSHSSRATPVLMGAHDGHRGGRGTCKGWGLPPWGQRRGGCRKRGTCPSQDERDLVGLLHSLATTLESFCKTHVPRLCPDQAWATPKCCLLSVCDSGRARASHSRPHPRVGGRDARRPGWRMERGTATMFVKGKGGGAGGESHQYRPARMTILFMLLPGRDVRAGPV